MVRVRAVADSDHAAWERLYSDYAAFYGVTQDDAMRARVWGWIHDPDHTVTCLVAEDETGALVGLAHYREFSRPLAAATGAFLDDLFVDPAARGSGAAKALIEAVREDSLRRGWSLVRWITADDNYRARSLYDKVANRTGWVTYDIPL
ncbi:MAG: GNAT family N-acetyltransferase [Marivivens sp.]|jgi:GNAT superfamily N-acetyltransferase|nr:GNAT family N-acetyltransferase [Marivivens sp.]